MTRPISEMTRAELVGEVVRLQQRNADLEAQVERLRTACQIAFQTPLDEHYSKGVNVALCHAIESTAETSLARLIAEKQAEALDDAAEEFEAEGIHLVAAQALRHSAYELRRQAEESDHG